MTLANGNKSWTYEDLLAMPDDGVERYIINGELREIYHEHSEDGVTKRSYPHSRSMMKVGQHLLNWLDTNPHVGGRVVGGEAGVRLSGERDITVGVDAAYVGREVAEATDSDAYLIDGPPVMIAEILSPSDTHRGVVEKVRVYLTHGVKMVWVIDPEMRVVVVHRPGETPKAFDASGRVEGFAELPGFACAVADLF